MKKTSVSAAADLINNIIFSYPNIAEITPGSELTYEIIVPPASQTATLTIPLTGSSVSWTIKEQNRVLINGIDYWIIGGGEATKSFSFVLKPSKTDMTLNVSVKVSIFVAYPNTPNPAPAPMERNFTHELQIKKIPEAVLNQATQTIRDALELTAASSIIEPGVPARLKIGPSNLLATPQTATSVLREQPRIAIKGALAVDNLVEALLSPGTGVLGNLIPNSKSSLNTASDEIRNVLSSIFAIPLSIEIQGDKLSTTLTPDISQGVTQLNFGSSGQSIKGVVPIGKWPAKFAISEVEWTFTKKDGNQTYSDLSPGELLTKSFLMLPEIVALGNGYNATILKPVTVNAKISIEFEDLNYKNSISLPPINLQCLPMPIPKIAAVFKKPFDDLTTNDQSVYITTDFDQAEYISSVSDCIRLLNTLASATNSVMAVCPSLQAQASEWTPIMHLSRATAAMLERISSIPPQRVYFRHCGSASGCTINLSSSNTGFNNAIAAAITIGPPKSDSVRAFRLFDTDANLWIDFNTNNKYVSIFSNFDREYKKKSDDLQQYLFPENSATRYDKNVPDDYNTVFEGLGYI